ncbi:MAG: TonB-dependent receptor [Candidatus Ferrigenium altingense]|jgi:outer membrane receptor protein involved in Fe transport
MGASDGGSHASPWLLAIAMLICCAGSVRAENAPETDASIITAADIAQEKPSNLMEMLRSRVGLDENNSVITMRGVRGIAIFVDGFASSVSELKALKPEQVEKIEILRGAASARFGADAMGGAIAVTTRGANRSLHASLVQGYDSRDGRYTRVTGGRDADGFGWSLLAEDRLKNGFRTVPDSPFPYQITVADERSKSTLLDGKLGWRGRDLDVSVNLKNSDNWAFFGRPVWAFDWRTGNARAQLAWRASNALTVEAALGEERYATSGTRDRGTGIDAAGLAPERWLTQNYRQREGTAALAWRDGDRQARMGMNLVDMRENFANADYASRLVSASTESLIRKQAVFASAETPLGDGKLELGLRRDLQRYVSSRIFSAGPPAQETQGGGVVKLATSPKVALSWPINDGYRLRGSIGTGFSPPGASQLYNGYVGAGSVTLANPGLKPERSTTADLTLSRSNGAGDWGLTLFATRWEDKIATLIVDYGTPVVQQPQNVGEVMAHGLEAQWSRRLTGGWSLAANYTHARTRVVRNLANPALVGNELPNMPRHKANLALAYEPGGEIAARAKLRAIGSAFTDDANTVFDARGYRWKKSAYAVLDLAATWRRPSWEFTLALDNAFDRDYVTGFFWHQEPRTLRGEFTLRY